MLSSKAKYALITFFVVLCATAVIAQDFMPAPDISARVSGKGKTPKLGGKKPPKLGAYLEVDFLNAIEMGGDQLMRWQHTDGGWRWPEDFSSTSTISTASQNQLGVVARGLNLIDSLIPAKDYIGDGSYPGARFTGEKIQERVLATGLKFYAPDYTFMCELTDSTGDPDYKTSATQAWAWKKANVAAYSTPLTFVQYFVTNRASVGMFNSGWGYGLMVWDLAGYSAAAEKVGDHVYANSILDYLVTEHDWSPVPGDPYWNDTANGYNKCIMHNFLKRWDDGTPTSPTAEQEWTFVSGAGHMLWAMNIVDSATYGTWITDMKTRLIAVQDTNPVNPSYGAYLYTVYGDPDVYAQDQGYAMMGMRNVGEQSSGRKATEWAINNQETSDPWTGMWREPWDSSPPWYKDHPSYQEGNSEVMQGMWDIHEGDENPWVMITQPPGSHVDDVPVSFKIFDMQSNPATIKVEYTINDGVDWNLTTSIVGGTTGLATTPTGVEHSISWDTYPTDLGLFDYSCKLRIWACDDSNPGAWGSPPGMTDAFTVLNATIPVEISIFNVE